MKMISAINKPARSSLRFTALSSLCALASIAALSTACADDDEPAPTNTAKAGSGGAGAAGKAGNTAGGSGGAAAGTGGTSAGAGGTAAGNGGTSAGNGGTSAGSAGSAGAAAGSAGSAGATAGSAGAAGAAGGSAGAGGAGGLTVGTPIVIKGSDTGHDRFFSVGFAADGTAYAVGQVQDTTAATDDVAIFVAKLEADGSLDTTWAENGISRHNLAVGLGGEVPRGIIVQTDGKILVGATGEHVEPTGTGGQGGAAGAGGAGGANPKDRDIIVLRLNADGSKDASFGTGGVKILDLSPGVEIDASTYTADAQYGFALQSDGKIVVSGVKKRDAGTDLDHVVLRLNTNGELDDTFATGGIYSVDILTQGASPRTVTILDDGSIISSGYSKTIDAAGVVHPVVFKLDKDGKPVTTFATNGLYTTQLLGHTAEAYGCVAQGNKLAFIGYGKNAAADKLDWISWRLDAEGKLDKTFAAATDGLLKIDNKGLDDNGRGLVDLPDGRLLFVGRAGAEAGPPATYDGMIAIVSADGVLDASFGTGGKRVDDLGGANDQWWVARTSPDKKRVVVVGVSGTTSTNDNAAVTTITLP